MKKKIILSVTSVVVIAISCFAVMMVSKAQKFDASMEQLQIHEVDLSAVGDGTYTGEVDTGVIQVMVEVVVQDHKMVGIDLIKHKNGQGDAASSITNQMVEEQKILVDAVSGATLSSKVIQKAVEIALTGE